MTGDQTASIAAWQHERRWLGYAGLLPFVASLGVLLGSADSGWRLLATDALLNYAAVIASFIGAVHWGLSERGHGRTGRIRLRWGVTPALVAWGLLALPSHYALPGFALLFPAMLAAERAWLPLLGDDYRALRTRLTSVATATLVIATALTWGQTA